MYNQPSSSGCGSGHLLRRKLQLYADIPEVISTRLDRKAPVNETADLEKAEWFPWFQI
ncbi:hypothetical protein FOIG_16563 [Fusarium odoratissimum NRRL 54006]|uniref:Uncharacterized protein n=2 Tax=Fusarium oxysporum species complex TaxID=171631 RepID=X0IMS1_FUSO5|nr:uncharacterized protein FOIG_16563 [Fusarium odoratissimum NRRL 54006]EXL90162.1 hypothetical protein FOIG_16563 [Fusarium odoratissimum NRRL 54006]TXB97584.1 hypothetical protein FocTR4_00012063 [Fusarium oxysporum f. sp. cubense]